MTDDKRAGLLREIDSHIEPDGLNGSILDIISCLKRARDQIVEDGKPRDGNFLDGPGCCKVCDGEIPDGHMDNCDIWKIEKRARQLEAALRLLSRVEQSDKLAEYVREIARQALAAAGGTAPPTTTAPGEELPGMLAVARGVHLHEWPHTMDARVWADHWIEITRDKARADFMDHGWMTSWFANAIMAGYDTANQLASAARAASCEQVLRDLRGWDFWPEIADKEYWLGRINAALASAGHGKERG